MHRLQTGATLEHPSPDYADADLPTGPYHVRCLRVSSIWTKSCLLP